MTTLDLFLRLLARGGSSGFLVILGGREQRSALMAVLKPRAIWTHEPWTARAKALLRGRWTPGVYATERAAREVFINDVFGESDDFGPELMALWQAHGEMEWKFDALTDEDEKRVAALEANGVIVRNQLRDHLVSDSLRLQLAKRKPELCSLAYPLVVKTPVISFRHFLDVHSRFAFNAIRHSGHPHANDLVSLTYELLFLQQKTALALAVFLQRAVDVHHSKKTSSYHLSELEALLVADLIVPYLKATIEKTLSLVGVTHGITDLDGKKTHEAKLRALKEHLPAAAQATEYFDFLLHFVEPEQLDELNRYRTGMLHKKGVARLQPHSFVGIEQTSAALLDVFSAMREQHARNTAILLAAFALLTDQLVRLSPPTSLPNLELPSTDKR